MNNSKLSIGTVQFGMLYGIVNNQEQVDYKDVSKILGIANQHGINMLDTAPSYGNSEEILGSIIYGQSLDIVTKVPRCNGDVVSTAYLDSVIVSLYRSLEKLNVNGVYGLLIHECDDLFKLGGERIFAVLEKIRSMGIVNKIGVSVYTDEQISRVLDNFDIDIIQVPVNIFDQRLVRNGLLDKLKKQGVEIHARSAFLQGILLMPLDLIPSYFYPIIKKFEDFNTTANKLSLTNLELALSYIYSIREVDRIIVGVKTEQQLLDIVNSKIVEVLSEDVRHLSITDPCFLNPSLWSFARD
jgi:aryl-alcohol dehydrogenase-like predicted oxidoreductase